MKDEFEQVIDALITVFVVSLIAGIGFHISAMIFGR